MSKQTAQKLIDRATEYQLTHQLAQLALKLAALPDDQISADRPEIQEIREIREAA